jgi:O-antigen/teichoic acid export membrane protein
MKALFQKIDREIFVLIGGRTYYRVAAYIFNISLFFVWNKSTYGEYTAKINAWGILQPILSIGLVKCAVKLLPLYQKIKNDLLRKMVILTIIIGLLELLIAVSVNLINAALNPQRINSLNFLAGSYAVFLGVALALQGLGRGYGRNSYDYLASIFLGSSVLLLCVCGFFKTLSPLFVLTALNLIYLLLDIKIIRDMIKKFPVKQQTRGKNRKNFMKRIVGETMNMGVNGLIGTANLSVINFAFQYFGLYNQSAYFNFIFSIFSFGLAFFDYILLLLIPKITNVIQRFKRNYRDLDKKYIILTILCILIFCIMAAGLNATALNTPVKLVLIWICLSPILIFNETIILWFEVLSRKALANATRGLIFSFLICFALSFILIPHIKDTGAIYALIGGDIGTILFLLYAVSRKNFI